MLKRDVDVLVIGAGQAGLAAGYFLQQTGISYLIIDKNEEIGAVWKSRYDSLVLFTPRHYSSLPGLAMTGEGNGYPSKDEVARYLQTYAKRFSLNIQLNTELIRLQQDGSGFRCWTASGVIQARRIIVATGPFQRPYVPGFSQEVPMSVRQLHSTSYRNLTQLQEGAVLVVGGGNSGAQIAEELAGEREVYLSVGHRMKFLPLQWLGKSVFWWLDKLGLLRADGNLFWGRKLRRMEDPVFGSPIPQLIRTGQVRMKPRAVRISSGKIEFEDGTKLSPDNVIWATGFRPDYSWLEIPGVLDENGRPVHSRGVSTTVPNLYYVGLPWQYNRASALLTGVGSDAEYIVNHLRTNM
ncbi:Uncharacterized oxidoreductase CzcO [Chlamydia abortus]|nr:Uncharacterized oxidoreductase CzcO [Chlamydia abortus]